MPTASIPAYMPHNTPDRMYAAFTYSCIHTCTTHAKGTIVFLLHLSLPLTFTSFCSNVCRCKMSRHICAIQHARNNRSSPPRRKTSTHQPPHKSQGCWNGCSVNCARACVLFIFKESVRAVLVFRRGPRREYGTIQHAHNLGRNGRNSAQK